MKQEINGEQFTFFPTSAPFPADHLEQSSLPFYSCRAEKNGQDEKTQHSMKIRSSHAAVRLLSLPISRGMRVREETGAVKKEKKYVSQCEHYP